LATRPTIGGGSRRCRGSEKTNYARLAISAKLEKLEAIASRGGPNLRRRWAKVVYVVVSKRAQAASELAPNLRVPDGLRMSRMTVGAEELAVLSFSLPDSAPPDTLTVAERAVAAALLEGLSNAKIASARRTSVRTVANQVASVLRKLGVRSRSEAAAVLGRVCRAPAVAATRVGTRR
jgi:DNA-binding CsgD family transcriptional regulator